MSTTIATHQRQFLAATGYFELGMLEEAAEELNGIAEDHQSDKEILVLRLVLATVRKEWAEAAEVGARVAELSPDEAGLWIQYAYAVRRANSVEAAEEILLRAVELHPNEATIHYNLACYAGVTGRLAKAKKHLKEAFALQADLRKLALSDDDLVGLWDFVEDGE